MDVPPSDFGDELVVDIYYDERYGTAIFDTVSGISKCPHEKNTAYAEMPGLEVVEYPPPIIFPDDPMIFRVKMSNTGEGPWSEFELKSESSGSGGLSVSLAEEVFNITKNGSIVKDIVVEKGPRLDRDDEVQLKLESTCE